MKKKSLQTASFVVQPGVAADRPERLFLLPGAAIHDPAVAAWFSAPHHTLRFVAEPWFARMRACGSDVREILNDGHPTVCVGEAAFASVNAFTAHVSVAFFYGAMLEDPAGLLQGAGKRMRHVKLRFNERTDAEALSALIAAAYRDIRQRLGRSG